GEAPAIAETKAGTDGRFTVMAPRAGMWRVTVSAPGRVAVQAALTPLVAPEALPEAVLLRDAGLRLHVEDADGKPIPGARILGLATKAFDQDDPVVPPRWEPAPRRAIAGANGEARLARAADEALQVRTVAPGTAVFEAPAIMAAGVTLRLRRDAP